jgi:hypothetical protein
MPWETCAAGPFDDREVAVWALARDRLGVQARTGDEEVEGFEEARNRARELAGV